MATTKKAKKASRKVRKRAEKAGAAAQDKAADLAERAGAVAQERAGDLAKRLRKSEALAKAQRKGVEFSEVARERWEDAELDRKAVELAGRLRERLDDAELDKRAAQLAARLREHDRTRQAMDKARDVTDVGLAGLGAWLAKGKSAEKLGVEPRRRLPMWLVALLGAVAGFVVGRMTADRMDAIYQDDLSRATDHLLADAPGAVDLADSVRAQLSSDPRTAQLEALNVNVSNGTVFVRGELPSDTDVDEQVIRDVISTVPGVTDVDLELGAGT